MYGLRRRKTGKEIASDSQEKTTERGTNISQFKTDDENTEHREITLGICIFL